MEMNCRPPVLPTGCLAAAQEFKGLRGIEFAEPAPGLVLLHGRIHTEDDKARSTEIPNRLRSVPVRSLLQVSPETYRSFYLSTCFPLTH